MTHAPADAAWVTIDTPLAPARMVDFCRDLERLYRINPYLEFRHWHDRPGGGAEVSYRNLSNGRDVVLQLRQAPESELAFTVHYDRGIKRSTRFEIEPADGGSRLKIIDDYDSLADSQTQDLGAVDCSLHAWGVALRDYLIREARWGHISLWRCYMRRVWVPMKPAARRITYIILLITLAEIALSLLVLAIYWVETRG
jgi:hypothetical protein